MRLSVIQQVREAFKVKNRLAAIVGALLGGFVPTAVYTVARYELVASEGFWQVPSVLVLGGLLFSAITVYSWCREAFQACAKAVGFVLLAEGVMTFGHIPWLSVAALAYLVGINAISTACQLALPRK
jgi:hypothetical protein